MLFNIKGYVNRYNCRILESEPSVGICIKCHSCPKINLWAGLTFSCVIDPYFLESMVKATHYLKMLKEVLVPYLKRKRKLKSKVFHQEFCSTALCCQCKRVFRPLFWLCWSYFLAL